MLSRIVSLSLVVAVLSAAASAHGLTAKPGYTATTLYSSAGTDTTIGGLDIHKGRLYFGQYTDIVSLDPGDLSTTVVGNVPSNAGNAFVTVKPNDGTVYTAFGTDYSPPNPHEAGYLDAYGVFQHQLDMDGIYDAAVNGSGELFLVASPSPTGEGAPDGSRIYRYDWSNGSTIEVAHVGGYSGGLAFDADDNLYYSAYSLDQVLRFDAADVAAGGLGLGNATSVLDLDGPGFLAFDDAGGLFATNLDASWNTHLALYDLTTATKIADVAEGGGKLVWSDGTLYTIDTDWSDYSSTIVALRVVPEPGLLGALATLMLAAAARRRRSH